MYKKRKKIKNIKKINKQKGEEYRNRNNFKKITLK
jgi:hypothetical protein